MSDVSGRMSLQPLEPVTVEQGEAVVQLEPIPYNPISSTIREARALASTRFQISFSLGLAKRPLDFSTLREHT